MTISKEDMYLILASARVRLREVNRKTPITCDILKLLDDICLALASGQNIVIECK